MGVTITGGTLMGGKTPICNRCNVLLCWDISDEEYEVNTKFWDEWICQDCNGDNRLHRSSPEFPLLNRNK
jgi:hypothetical protein